MIAKFEGGLEIRFVPNEKFVIRNGRSRGSFKAAENLLDSLEALIFRLEIVREYGRYSNFKLGMGYGVNPADLRAYWKHCEGDARRLQRLWFGIKDLKEATRWLGV